MGIYQAIQYAGFGKGLNLRDKEDAVAPDECIDAINVEFTERGAIRQRGGYETFATSQPSNRVDSAEVFKTSTGTNQLILGCGSRLARLATDGSISETSASYTANAIWDFARFGAPGTEVLYAGNGNDLLQKWNGTTWSSVSGSPSAGALTVMSVDSGNRMVAGRFETTTGGPGGGASSSNPSRVYFSDAGAPETWGVNNYVDFHPGDGEKIQAVCRWGQLVFVFKETKYFVIYGSTEDAAGDPVFNWRTFDGGIGLAGPRAYAVTEDGIYFLNQRGVYRTTGDAPELVSSAVDPIFDTGSTPSVFYLGGTLKQSAIANCVMAENNGRLYLSFPTGNSVVSSSFKNDRILVFDTNYGWWSLFDFKGVDSSETVSIGASMLASWDPSGESQLFFGPARGTRLVCRQRRTLTSDSGTAITARWRSGWFDFESPDSKTIRESKVWAAGFVQSAIAVDFNADVGSSVQFDFPTGAGSSWGASSWGSSSWAEVASLDPELRRIAVQGTCFSTTFQNTALDKTFTVHRLVHHLRESRIHSYEKRND